jgi:hypothetical protein
VAKGNKLRKPQLVLSLDCLQRIVPAIGFDPIRHAAAP